MSLRKDSAAHRAEPLTLAPRSVTEARAALPAAARRQSGRDRGPHHARLPRAGHRDGRRLQRRGRGRAARPRSRTTRVRIGPAPASESYLRRRRASSRPRSQTGRRGHPSRATASCRSRPRSRRRSRPPASSFVGPDAGDARGAGRQARRAPQRGSRWACPSCPARSSPARGPEDAGIARPPRTSATRCSSRRPPAAAAGACGASTTAARPARRRCAAAAREAVQAFGDGAVYLEHYVEGAPPRRGPAAG